MSLDLSLYRLDQDLATLYDMRQQAEDAIVELSDPVINAAYPIDGKDLAEWKSEATVLDAAIAEYMTALPQKVDKVADYLRALELAAGSERMDRKQERGEIDQEIQRLKRRRDEIRARYSRIVDAVKFVLETGQWKPGQPKKLDGTRHTLSLRGNGVEPLEIYDPALVPDELCRVTVEMPVSVWRMMVARAQWAGVEEGHPDQLRSGVKIGPREPSNSAIREALAKPCPHCDHGKIFNPLGMDSDPITHTSIIDCPACGGSGKNSVAGARLLPRGSSLVVK